MFLWVWIFEFSTTAQLSVSEVIFYFRDHASWRTQIIKICIKLYGTLHETPLNIYYRKHLSCTFLSRWGISLCIFCIKTIKFFLLILCFSGSQRHTQTDRECVWNVLVPPLLFQLWVHRCEEPINSGSNGQLSPPHYTSLHMHSLIGHHVWVC